MTKEGDPVATRAIVWFRHDLRLAGNGALAGALLEAEAVAAVWVAPRLIARGQARYSLCQPTEIFEDWVQRTFHLL